MPSGLPFLVFFLLAPLLFPQTGLQMTRDVPYAEPKNERQLLDIYSPGSGANLPVVVWVHGGGWMRGSKADVDSKPAAFTQRGFVFVPVNYRYFPNVSMDKIVRDVAKATGWVHANIARYNGDPQRIFLMGHSAGAQLAALLCTDTRYIEAEGVPRSHIAGCVPVDGDTYDVPLQIATAAARRKSLKQPPPKYGHAEKFGTPAQHRELSAVNHVAANRGIAPFLILHVADHTDTSAQAQRLWDALDQAGIPTTIFGADNTDHVKLDRDLGTPNDPATAQLFAFTTRILRR
ncbi:MAG: alpha/beta hydrolase [Bryobacteraceae bacterium]